MTNVDGHVTHVLFTLPIVTKAINDVSSQEAIKLDEVADKSPQQQLKVTRQ